VIEPRNQAFAVRHRTPHWLRFFRRLRSSAVYFKSGSLYSCEKEEGFTCKKYHGNKRNFMNSIAIIETPAGQNRRYYMATVLSNVLRKITAILLVQYTANFCRSTQQKPTPARITVRASLAMKPNAGR
jgi:hypothetical protein